MKDKTSIFKHSGAGTGFYGGAHWSCDYFQDPDPEIAGDHFQTD